MNYQFKNILGTFMVDENLNFVSNKFPSKAPELPKEKVPQILALFKDKSFLEKFYQENLKLTRQAIRNSISEDQLIIQAIANFSELDKILNIMVKRIREWYSLYLPELSEAVRDHETFLELLNKPKPELIREFSITQSMGAELDQIHVDQIKSLSNQTVELYNLRNKHEDYLQSVMEKHCPNLLKLAGVTIGAKLIELAKGLKNLALLPASTVQLLGAEKALFRHIKTGSRSPKHGIIINHPLVQNSKRDRKGKAARMLADKLSLCARLDYFKGEFKANEYLKELEETLQ